MFYAKQTYQSSGQRILRHIPTRVDVYSNATLPAQKERDVTMIYPSGLITAKVINPDSWGTEPGPVTLPRLLRYTKHYYIGTERISSVTDTKSNLGHFIENLSYNDFFPVSTLRAMSNAQVEAAGEALEETYDHFGLQYTVPAPVVEGSKPTPGYTDFNNASIGRYFFHPDHLGSSSYITDKAGVVSQHMEYLPFGELLVDEHLNSHNSPFKFNAKELDPETGNYYYGARYYDPKWSIWLSVDPLFARYPTLSPYIYTANNPVGAIDPDGRDIVIIGSPEYREKVMGELKTLASSSKAGAYQVQMAIKSNKTLVIYDPRYESHHGELTNAGDYEVLGMDLSMVNNPHDSANGRGDGKSLENNAQTFLAHELGHFNSEQNGWLVDENGYNTYVLADEVHAVEIENMVRRDLEMDERTHYGGIDVYGKEVTEKKSEKYSGGYILTGKQNYANKKYTSQGTFNYTIKNENRQTYYKQGKYIQTKTDDSKQTRISSD